MNEILSALRTLLLAEQVNLQLAKIDIYRDDFDIERRLQASQVPALCILDDGEEFIRGQMAGDANQIFHIRLRLLMLSLSKERVLFGVSLNPGDEKYSVYTIMEQLRLFLWKHKKLTTTCGDINIANEMPLKWKRTPILYPVAAEYWFSGHDIAIDYTRYVAWTSSRNDQA